jgi:Lecithin retinol acyltransferase
LERGGNGDSQMSNCEGPPYGGLYGAEGLLVAEPEPPLGAHIVTEHRGYTRHGIYVGAGKVVHYAGLSRGLQRGPVEEISLSRFACGHRVRVVSGVPPKFDGGR